MSGCLVVMFTWLIGMALSYGITVGIVYLVCLCFSLEFTWLVATGIWLVMLLISSIFKK